MSGAGRPACPCGQSYNVLGRGGLDPSVPRGRAGSSRGRVGAAVAVTLALWVHYGGAVFFNMIAAGFRACF
jgi:hypothetical protein